MILTNARAAKGDNARTTEVSDAEGLAALLGHGLLKPSFIPPLPIRELRALTRDRARLGRERTTLATRSQQLSESANIKLGQVASDALGVRGKARLRALAAGKTDAEQLSPLARSSLKRKPPQWQHALEGRVTQAQRWILAEWLAQYEHLEAALPRAEERIRQEGENSADPFVPEAGQLLDTIPGVGETVAQIRVAAVGVDRERFPPDPHWASGAGMCPGNKESAGKRRSGKTTKGSRYLRAARVQAAWAASHQQGTYLAPQDKRLVKRRGKKNALVAVGHRILVIASHVVPTRTTDQALGGDYCERRNGATQRKRFIRQLDSLGGKVTVEEIKEAA